MNNPWFRMYSEFATDPKVQMMSESMQRRWLMLLCLRCGNVLATLHATERDEAVAFSLRISDEECAKTKALLVSKDMIDDTWEIINWGKRQYASDSSTERSRRHREKKETERATHATLQKRSGNALDTDTDTDTEVNPTSSLRSDGEQVADDSAGNPAASSSTEGTSPGSEPPSLFADDAKAQQPKADGQAEDSLQAVIFAEGLPLMLDAGVAEKSARSLLGKLRSKVGDLEAVVVIEAMRREKPLDPSAWISKVINSRQDTRQTFGEWAAACKANGEKMISEYRPVLDYCEAIDLPTDFLNLAWSEFKRQHLEGGINAERKSDDWRATFRIAVERGYMRLWYRDQANNTWALTTQGMQAQAVNEAWDRRAAA